MLFALPTTSFSILSLLQVLLRLKEAIDVEVGQFSFDVAVHGSAIGPLVAPSDGSGSGRLGVASRRPGHSVRVRGWGGGGRGTGGGQGAAGLQARVLAKFRVSPAERRMSLTRSGAPAAMAGGTSRIISSRCAKT